jgi:protein-disulfide isomerase
MPALFRPFLLSLAFASVFSTAAAAEMTDAEREAFRDEVRAYLLENPEVLMEAMDVLRARDAEAAAARDVALLEEFRGALFDDPASWVGGNPEGDITIVEFVDYRCGYCRKAHSEIMELVESDGNIRLIMKEYPILGEQSLISARFAVAVLQLHGPDAYAVAHDALITLRGDATPETLARLAGQLGHDPAAILARMDSAEVTSVIDANHSLGAAMEVNGTPTFVVDGSLVRGYVPLDDMRAIVAQERAG